MREDTRPRELAERWLPRLLLALGNLAGTREAAWGPPLGQQAGGSTASPAGSPGLCALFCLDSWHKERGLPRLPAPWLQSHLFLSNVNDNQAAMEALDPQVPLYWHLRPHTPPN